MAQSPELRGLGPYGNRKLEAWGSPGLWVWGSRWSCESLDFAGIDNLRLGDARGRGHGAVAGTARARTQREWTTRGLWMPGVVGMAQTPEL